MDSRGGNEPNAIADLQGRQRRILSRNFKPKVLTFSVFSDFFRFSVRLCCMDKDGMKKTRKYRKSEKFGYKISAQNSSLPALQICDCVWLNAAPAIHDTKSSSKNCLKYQIGGCLRNLRRIGTPKNSYWSLGAPAYAI